MAYRLTHNLVPDVIKANFDNSPRHYNTRFQNIPKVCAHNTSLYTKSFMSKAIINFTRLPETIRRANNTKLFCKYFTKFKIDTY